MSDHERAPLLGQKQHSVEPDNTFLPKGQLAILCYLRILDPLNFTHLLPYINGFVLYLHVTDDPANVGFYSGLVENVFSIFQLIAVYPWAVFSDSVGYRPMVVVGTLGLALSTLMFGLSQNFATMILARAFAGFFSGNVVVIPSILCQITNEDNQSWAFPLFGIFWPLGSIIGPLVGGVLSNPKKLHHAFWDYALFKEFPYFLPSLVVSLLTGIGTLLCFIHLQETVSTNMDLDDRPKPAKSSNITNLLQTPMIRLLCLSGLFLSVISTSFEVLFVLFCYSSPENGGLGLETSEIGYALSISGLLGSIIQLCIMPRLLRHFDHRRLYAFFISMWQYAFLSFPLLYHLGQLKGVYPWVNLLLWGAIALTLAVTRGGYMCYALNTLLIKSSVPSMSIIATANGLLQFFIYLGRAVSPTLASLLFTISSKKQLVGGHFWALLLAALAGALTLSLNRAIRRLSETSLCNL